MFGYESQRICRAIDVSIKNCRREFSFTAAQKAKDVYWQRRAPVGANARVPRAPQKSAAA
jgi:hypothetical protein